MVPSINRSDENPYAPPTALDTGGSQSDVLTASRYLTRMGWLSIAYFVFVFVAGFVSGELTNEHALGRVKFAGIMVGAALIIALLSVLMRAAARLPEDFSGNYRKSRWLGLLLGAFFFPILTLPAFHAVSLLTKCRSSPAGKMLPP